MPTQVFAIFLELLESADSLQLGYSGLSDPTPSKKSNSGISWMG
jgi:hypothetical protein